MEEKDSKTFIRTTLLSSSDGVTYNQENTLNLFENRLDLGQLKSSFKSLHDQVKEYHANKKKIEAETAFDIKQINISDPYRDDQSDHVIVDPHDFYDYDDEFDYFQYYGSQAEGEGKWIKQIKEDEEKFKNIQNGNENEIEFRNNIIVQKPEAIQNRLPHLTLKIKPKVNLTEDNIEKDLKRKSNEIQDQINEKECQTKKVKTEAISKPIVIGYKKGILFDDDSFGSEDETN